MCHPGTARGADEAGVAAEAGVIDARLRGIGKARL